jgi:hypothetical protein
MSNPEILPPAIPADLPPPPNTILRGPNGIRAGWRALIFLAIVGALLTLVSIIVVLIAHGRLGALSQLTPAGLALSEGSIFLLTAIPALIMSRVEHRKFSQYGLPLRHAFQQLPSWDISFSRIPPHWPRDPWNDSLHRDGKVGTRLHHRRSR